MNAVLTAKVKKGSDLAKALEATGDSFLLFHVAAKGSLPDVSGPPCPFPESDTWSDDADGAGQNWLGMQLMLLRDRRTGWKRWTPFIEQSIDTKTGESRGPDVAGSIPWQDV